MKRQLRPWISLGILALVILAQLRLPLWAVLAGAAVLLACYVWAAQTVTDVVRLSPYFAVAVSAALVRLPLPATWPLLPRLLFMVGMWIAVLLVAVVLIEWRLAQKTRAPAA